MIVGWLEDKPGYVGGAELTMTAFRDAAPDDVETVDCPPGGVIKGLDAYVLGNCVQYQRADLEYLADCDGSVVKYVNDAWPNGSAEVRDWLLTNACCVFTSPLHADRFAYELLEPVLIIPPPIDLERFRVPRQSQKRRKGAVSINQWRNTGKGQQRLVEWSNANKLEVDIYGEGDFVPHGPYLTQQGAIPPGNVAQTLWRYETFIHLPTDLEPFGRTVVEAWAAGCRLIVNGLVGARHYIEHDPAKLATSRAEFWDVVMA